MSAEAIGMKLHPGSGELSTVASRRRPSPFALGLGATAVESLPAMTKAAAQAGEARNGKLTQAQIEANRRKSRIRVRIEHVFGAQENAAGGRLVRTIGMVRAKLKIGLQNLAYNIRRLVFLERMATA